MELDGWTQSETNWARILLTFGNVQDPDADEIAYKPSKQRLWPLRQQQLLCLHVVDNELLN
jgi:hypothetical protein